MDWEGLITAWAEQRHPIRELRLSEPLSPMELRIILVTFYQPYKLKEEQDADLLKLFDNVDKLRKNMGKIYEKAGLGGFGSKRKLLEVLSDEFSRLKEQNLSNLSTTESQDILEEVPLKFPEGVVPLNSRFYMEPITTIKNCYGEITRPKALLRIQSPRQRGKTSLLLRVISYAKSLNYRVARLDLLNADRAILEDLDLLLQWFCQEICNRLSLPIVVAEDWQNQGGSKLACTEFFEKYLLRTTVQPLLLSLDNLDQIFVAPLVGEDFASLLRAWHEKDDNAWEQLRIIILYVWYIEPQIMDQSPFNVGCPIDLPELTIDLVEKLVDLYGLGLSKEEVWQLTDLVGFHPFLIRLALYHMATNKTSLAEILNHGYLADGLFGNHLMSHLRYLERQPEELCQIMSQVVNSESPPIISSSLRQRLSDAGLVKLNGDQVVPGNKLYQLYFRARLQVKKII
jgi:hypothetical protein